MIIDLLDGSHPGRDAGKEVFGLLDFSFNNQTSIVNFNSNKSLEIVYFIDFVAGMLPHQKHRVN